MEDIIELLQRIATALEKQNALQEESNKITVQWSAIQHVWRKENLALDQARVEHDQAWIATQTKWHEENIQANAARLALDTDILRRLKITYQIGSGDEQEGE